MESLPLYNNVSEVLPSYHHRRVIEHAFYLKDSHNRTWATLKLQSFAQSSDGAPTFIRGDVLNGTVQLDLRKENASVRDISIKLLGQMIPPVSSERTIGLFEHGPDVFFDVSQSLWSCDGSHTQEKLDGTREWPFSLSVTCSSATSLPPSVLEKNACFGVRYTVFAHIRRGRLRSDDRFGCVMTYLSGGKPSPFSTLRQLAYESNTTIPGPDVDPQGWKTFQPTVMRGCIFKNRDTEVLCTLSIATPLSYTKGTAIPCVFVLESSDAVALDLLSSPDTVDVRLRRRVVWGPQKPSDKLNHREALSRNSAVDYPSSGTWGPVSVRGRQRILEGEIQLPSRLQPSFSHGKFSVMYDVIIFPFASTLFVSSLKGPILVETIEITDCHADGPLARPLLPPAPKFSPLEHPPGFDLLMIMRR